MAAEDVHEPTLGQKLKDARVIKHLSLEEAEAQSKIRLRHLAAIEEGYYHELPPDVFAVGFVRRYAKLLGLNPDAAAALFRRERAASKLSRRKIPSFAPAKLFQRPRLVISSRALLSLAAGLVVLLLFGYIWYQVRQFAAAPTLSITSPAQDSVVSEGLVTVSGTTNPAATLFINLEAIPLDEQGVFRQDVRLTPGVNTIEVKAVNRLRKETTEVIHVLYQVESPTITPPIDSNFPPTSTSER